MDIAGEHRAKICWGAGRSANAGMRLNGNGVKHGRFLENYNLVKRFTAITAGGWGGCSSYDDEGFTTTKLFSHYPSDDSGPHVSPAVKATGASRSNRADADRRGKEQA